jgi:hypothetical protein
MVVKEAKRAYTYLSLGYVTDAVIVNRLLPGNLHDERSRSGSASTTATGPRSSSRSAAFPSSTPLFDSEVVGTAMPPWTWRR